MDIRYFNNWETNQTTTFSHNKPSSIRRLIRHSVICFSLLIMNNGSLEKWTYISRSTINPKGKNLTFFNLSWDIDSFTLNYIFVPACTLLLSRPFLRMQNLHSVLGEKHKMQAMRINIVPRCESSTAGSEPWVEVAAVIFSDSVWPQRWKVLV